ncbi:dermonecrotic toxin domain-containing protein [Pseudomonas typographi]|uniref:dermonecrotic toxin domain-containing protein n=2 Tax=Pseudomonas typographi TaxID=2715964 RepID=UPI00168307AD|nr:DUF6543 domain-containing protein [Pseudomonas typographi]MBD1586661.1 hypothetical protein [Pseudomonas typographi]
MDCLFDIIERFASRPSLRDVAAEEISALFTHRFPDDRLKLGTACLVVEDQSTAPRAVADEILDRFSGAADGNWAQDTRTVVDEHGVAHPQLPILALGELIDSVAVGLLGHYAEALVRYWAAKGDAQSASRLGWLATRLSADFAGTLRAAAGTLSDSEYNLGRTLLGSPGKAARDLLDSVFETPSAERLQVSVPLQRGGQADALYPCMLIRAGQAADATRLLYWPLAGLWAGERARDGLRSLQRAPGRQVSTFSIPWVEPPADAFEGLALAMLDRQLAELAGLAAALPCTADQAQQYVAAVSDLSRLLGPFPQPPAAQLKHPLPQWLAAAPLPQRLAYGQALAKVAAAQRGDPGRPFDDGVPSLRQYAKDALLTAIRQRHPGFNVPLSALTLRIDRVVGTAVASGADLRVVGGIEPVSMPVLDFALNNLSGLPAGARHVLRGDGVPVPSWLTPQYLARVVEQVDVGGRYPHLVKAALLDSPDAAWRRAAFARQLSLQLPLQAMEQAIRHEQGLTWEGYRVIAAMFGATSEPPYPEPVVLRHLAFRSRAGAAPDVAEHLYVAGPLDMTHGPVLLYEPLAPRPLHQWASWHQLRAAVATPGPLQARILPWLSDAASGVYADGGFEQPRFQRFGQGDEYAPVATPQPAELADVPVAGAVSQALYENHIQALVHLAERNSVSNHQSRWAQFKAGGWLLLDTLLSVVSGPLPRAVWLLEALGSFESFIKQTGDMRRARLAEVLMNVSLAVLHDVRWSAPAYLRHPQHDPLPPTAPKLPASLQPAAVPPGSWRMRLDFAWAGPYAQPPSEVRARLATLRGNLPRPLPPSQQSGRYAGLVEHGGHWYAPVGKDVYPVKEAAYGFYIVDPTAPAGQGPAVQWLDGQWRLDLPLRLRGGGPRTVKAYRALRERVATELQRLSGAVLEQIALQERYEQHYEAAAAELRPRFLEKMQGVLTALVDMTEQRRALDAQLLPADRLSPQRMATEVNGLLAFIGNFIERLWAERQPSLAVMVSCLKADGLASERTYSQYRAALDVIQRYDEWGMKWSQAWADWTEHLRSAAVVGPAQVERQWVESAPYLEVMRWRGARLFDALELSLTREALADASQASGYWHMVESKWLRAAVYSHMNLDLTLPLSDRIEVLESSLRSYERAVGITTLAQEGAAEASLEVAQLGRALAQLGELQALAERQVAAWVAESASVPTPATTPALAARPSPRVQVVRTVDERTVLARAASQPSELPGQVAEMVDFTGQVIETYHLHEEDGLWHEVVEHSPVPAERAAPARVHLRQRIEAAINRCDADLDQVRRLARAEADPKDIEDLLVHKADRLQGLFGALQQADRTGWSSEQAQGADALIARAMAAEQRLRDEGQALRVELIKAQRPTASRVDYLVRGGQAYIERVGQRRALQRPGDFLEEYRIVDTEHKTLWWAHFHYDQATAPAEAYVAAHLKLATERKLGYRELLGRAGSGRAALAVYRSSIGPALAQRLFLAVPRT